MVVADEHVGGARTWLRDHVLLLDAALANLAAIVLVAASASLAHRAGAPGHASGGRWGTDVVALLVIEVGALALRRSRPQVSAAIVFGAAFAHYLLSARAGLVPLLPADVAVLVAAYSVAVHGARWSRWTALAVCLLGAALQGGSFLWWSADPLRALPSALVYTAVLAVLVLLAWITGQWRRTRLEFVASLLDRAQRAETAREQQDVISAAAERARIARELHDIVAHSLSVIIAQADGGRYAAAASPQAAVGALETVASTGRAALTDMRRLLGVLRRGEGGDLAPQPDAASVPGLVATVREAGLPVALVTTGTPRRLSPGAGLAVYRLVQEGLTNVLKHGGPGVSAQVRLHWTAQSLEIRVEDDGRGASASSDGVGRGLAGLGERVAIHGGRLHSGPRAQGGFAVRALLPVPGAGAGAITTGQTEVS